MPLIKIEEVLPDVRIGLWHVTETSSVLFDLYPQLLIHKTAIDMYKSEIRRLEYIVVRVLLSEMEGHGVEIYHDENGKPLLSNGCEISISHTLGYVAVIVSPRCRVAVDIEYTSTRVSRVVSHFLRDDEKAYSVHEQLFCWCAKETAYKLFSYDKLAFHEIRIPEFILNGNAGTVNVENLKRCLMFPIHYNITDDFMLTYAVY